MSAQAGAAHAPAEIDPDVEEVRLALALNGGVSLAVWMGGCAVELDRARRTHHSSGSGPAEGGIYQALCDAFRRELVVDVMSGSSAGGINGALLAAALAHGRPLDADFLRDRWLKLGDFSRLLQPLSARSPTALMQGDYFAVQLGKTFDALINELPVVEPPLIPALDITTTDITGRLLSFVDTWRGELHAREYRARFAFREAEDFTADKLAAAARASASFPLAFAPYPVPEAAAGLAGLKAGGYVVDGGLLDNAPIQAALSLIPSRPATRQVRRLLCYVNGEPAQRDKPAEDRESGVPLPGGEAQRSNGEPNTRDVVGVVLNLPRKAPFADQLRALQAVSRNSEIADHAEHDLLTADLEPLHAVAEALLPTYRRRRCLRALNETFHDPARVQRAYELLRQGEDLPWLRGSLDPDPGSWPWGIDAARRVHQLSLDLIGVVLPGSDAKTRHAVLKHRPAIDERVLALDKLRREDTLFQDAVEQLVDGRPATDALQRLNERVDRDRVRLAEGLEATARSLLKILNLACAETAAVAAGAIDVRAVATDIGHGLFGVDVRQQAELQPDMQQHFLRRVIAVEIIRRSFIDDEAAHNAQQVSFAQLTPEAPDPIFAATGLEKRPNPSVGDKLCGAILGHFGAFYRRSWRANDFLWGRMDAGARIVEMLVGAQRSRHLLEADQHHPWEALARSLVAAGPEQRELLREALDDLAPGTRGEELEPRLRDVLRRDLEGAPDDPGTGKKTRIICQRAVQFEILCDELRHVRDEAAKDYKLGCSPATLGLDGLALDTKAGVLEAIHRLRDSDCKLPVALGRDSDDEKTSDLAARTIAHAGLVTLGVSRGAGGRIVSPVTSLRSALLPVSGAVALHPVNRLGVVAAFSAAAAYLGARIAGTNDARVVNAAALSIPELLLAVVSLLVVLGTAALPFARAFWGKHWRRWAWFAIAVTLLGVGGVGAGFVATVFGPLGWAHLLVAPGVQTPWIVGLLPIALGTGAARAGPRPLRKPLEDATAAPWNNWSLALVVAAAAIIFIWAWSPITGALDGTWWQQTAAYLAIAAIPVSFTAVVALPPLLAKRPPKALPAPGP